jgi:hypothetical protein
MTNIKGLIRLELIVVIVMLLLTIVSQQFVMRKMQVLRMQMGSVAATSTNDPLRVQFDRLHDVSADIEGAVLLIGLVTLFLTVRSYRLWQNRKPCGGRDRRRWRAE